MLMPISGSKTVRRASSTCSSMGSAVGVSAAVVMLIS